MPVTPTYPGVYIEEIPSGVRTIMGVATSITAFIGRALRGPVNDPITINSFADYERVFGGLWEESTMSYAVRDFYLNGGRQSVIVRLVRFSGTDTGIARITLPTGGADPNDKLWLDAANPGSWGDNLSVDVNHETKDYDTDNPDRNLFNLTVSEVDPQSKKVLNAEPFSNVSVDSGSARYLPKVLEERSALVRVPKNDAGEYIMPNIRPVVTTAAAPTSPPGTGVKGDDGLELTQNQFINSTEASQDDKTGLYALEKADLFNLLCIPPFTPTEDITPDLITDAARYCEDRRSMLLVDAPASWTNKSAAKKGFTNSGVGTTSKNAAVFFPRLKKRNPLHDNQMEEFAPSGAVAGVFARTDAQRGVWKAPAGQEASLVGVPLLSVPLTDDENGELNKLGINCLRAFPVYGRLVWGSRTLQGADRLSSEWKYISVRRMALYIEESLYRGTQWVVFEPNDEPLWAQIRLNVGAFMHNLFRQGAFQGKTPRDAYLVKCDKETTTPNDVNQGIVNILVGFAPLKPAEFVFIKIQQLAGQIES